MALTGATFDFETDASLQYEAKVLAVAAGPSTTATSTLTIVITDVNEAPTLTLTPGTIGVDEGYTGNLAVTISKTDVDITNGQTITYALTLTSPHAGGPFSIDAATGKFYHINLEPKR